MTDWIWSDQALPPGDIVSTVPGLLGRLLGLCNTLVIRCKLADHMKDLPGEPAEPAPDGGYDTYFTSAGAGQGAVYDYLNTQMMGTRHYDAAITDWYTLTQTEADLIADRATDRLGIARVAARAAAADHEVGAYENLVVIVNAPSTSRGDRGGDFAGGYPCTVDGRDHGVTVIGSSGFDLNGVLQEMLHAYPVAGRTLAHGRHAYWPGMTGASDYGDPFDVMSAFDNHRLRGPFGDQGANLSGARRQLLGWIPEGQRATYEPDKSASYPPLAVTLQPLGGAGAGVQIVVIPVGDDTAHYYTVEYRRRTGWDHVLPTDGVLIYEVRPDNIAYLITRRPAPRAQFDAQRLPGESWTGPLAWGQLTVAVERADADSATVRLSVA